MTLATPTAILEPQITLHSVEGDNVILHASPEWKKKLIDFLKYAETTDDAEIDCIANITRLEEAREVISKQVRSSNVLKLSKLELLGIIPAFIALSDYPACGFYDYPADDFDRLHDDIFDIGDTVFEKNKAHRSRRIKTELSSKFDG